MNKDQIEQLMNLIPAPNAFLPSNLSAKEQARLWNPSSRRAVCMNNPAFGWLFVRTFAEAGRALPSGNGVPPVIQRAYDYLCGKATDRDIEGAVALSLDTSGLTHKVLEALLLCTVPKRSETAMIEDLSDVEPLALETIAGHLQVRVQVVKDYHDLFFNIRPRLADKPYISSIVYPKGRPETRTAHFRKFGTLRQKLLIAGYEVGVDAVLEIAGYCPSEDSTGLRPGESARRFRNKVIECALNELAFGDADSPLIAVAAKMVPADDESNRDHYDDSYMGLTAVSQNYPVLETIKKMAEPAVRQMLEIQQQSYLSGGSQVKPYNDEELTP